MRDPVARNIATFFENLHEFVPDWQQQDQDDPLFMQKLQQTFLNIQTIHSEPYRWFDEQLLPMFGIDVFSEVFPHEVGYKIYVANSRLSLLIIRLEDLSRIGSVVIKQFLKLEDFELFNTNIGEDKKYANLYRKFKQQPLPSEYLHKIYKTKYAKTFYSKVELEEFEKQWLQIPSQNRKAIDYPKLNTAPILIYQMGKVGSVTIQASLEKAYQDMKVYTEIKRIHLMNLSVDDAKELLKYEYVKLDKTLGAIKNGLELRETIDANPQKKWKLISLVREPVGRNVATFFQSLEEFVPDWEERLASNSLTAKELQEIFLSKETLHRGPHQWFDNELKAVFNINVYDISFPMERGYKIYATEYHHPLLIMRLENLNSYAKEALERFLGLRNIKLISTNIGGNKPYAKLYQEFKDLPLPLTYVEKMYNTKYARHFYSDSELEDFMKKWTRR